MFTEADMQADATQKTWSDERIEQLRALWAGGSSARQIADHLGGMTCITVIGKLDRLGLLGAPRGAARDSGPAAESESWGKAARPERQARPIPSERATPTQIPDAKPSVPGPQAMGNAPGQPLVDIQALGTESCRWPVGDPQRAGFGFCGVRAPHGRPYCDAHAKLAYEPPRERRRAS